MSTSQGLLVISLSLIMVVSGSLVPFWGRLHEAFSCKEFVVICSGLNSSCEFDYLYSSSEELTVISEPAPQRNHVTFKEKTCGIVSNASSSKDELIHLIKKLSQLDYSFSTTFWPLLMSPGQVKDEELQKILQKNWNCLALTRHSLYFVFRYLQWLVNETHEDVWECFHRKDVIVVRKLNSPGTSAETYEETRIQRRLDFEAMELVAVAAEDLKTRVEVSWDQDESGTVQFTSGFATSIFHDLRDSLNFKAKYILGDWISQHPNESLKGKTYGYLSSGKVDLMIGHTVMLPHRARQLQYLQPTYLHGLSVFLQQPSASTVTNLFLAPFNKELWAALLSIWMVTLALTFLMRMIRCQLHQEDELDDCFDLGESFVWLVGTICQQGWHSRPQTSSMKIVFLVAAMSASVVYMAYTATIVSVLSVERVPIKSLDDLFHSHLKMYASGESSTLKYYLMHLYKDKPELILPNGEQPWLSVVQGVQNLFRNSMAFLSYNHIFHLECQALGINDRERCSKIYNFPVTSSLQPSGMTLPKNTSFAEIFNFRIMQFKEKGYMFRHNSHFKQATSLVCIKRTSRHRAMLGIDDTLTAYVILICGYILSISILGMEVAWDLYIKRVNNIRQRLMCNLCK